MKTLKTSQELGVVPNWHIARKIIPALFNECGIDAYMMTWEGKDTEFSYMIYSEKTLSKASLSHALIWVQGFIAGQKYI